MMKKSPIFLTRRTHSDSVLDQVSSSAFFRALFSPTCNGQRERELPFQVILFHGENVAGIRTSWGQANVSVQVA